MQLHEYNNIRKYNYLVKLCIDGLWVVKITAPEKRQFLSPENGGKVCNGMKALCPLRDMVVTGIPMSSECDKQCYVTC